MRASTPISSRPHIICFDAIMFYKLLLFPFSLLYDMVTSVRNIFFNKGWFRSQCYSLPIISVGNIVVGGTGKTPHTEYLIRLIRPIYRLCTLSRGYGRKTKGFRWVSPKDVACNVGDEPLQMSQKFTDVRVAV